MKEVIDTVKAHKAHIMVAVLGEERRMLAMP